MARLIRNEKKAITFVELLVTLVVFTTVVTTAAAVLNSFKKFYIGFTKSAGITEEITMTAFDKIAEKIRLSNNISITNGVLSLRVDTNNTPSNYSDDSTYRYWYESNAIKTRVSTMKLDGTVVEGLPETLCTNLTTFYAVLDPTDDSDYNRVKMRMDIQLPDNQQFSFETVAVSRCRCAQQF